MTSSDVGLRRKPPPPAGTAMYCLPSLPRYVDGNRMRGRDELLAPQFLAVARINRAEDAVDRRADEHEVPGRGDAATQARRARGLEALGDELRIFTERNPPRKVSGVRVHRNQLAPGRLRARVLVARIPEASAFGRHFAHARHGRPGAMTFSGRSGGSPARPARPRAGVARAPPHHHRGATAATGAFLEVPPLTGVMDIRDHQARAAC